MFIKIDMLLFLLYNNYNEEVEMGRDELIDFMGQKIKRWQNADQRVDILGQTITASPQYLSLTLLEKDNNVAEIHNGGISSKPAWSDATGYQARCFVGDEENGLSGCIMARDEIPRSPEALDEIFEKGLDEGLKGAMGSFMQTIGENIQADHENLYKGFSRADVPQDVQDSPVIQDIPPELIDALQAWSKGAIKHDFINEAIAKIAHTYSSRRFVDSEGRKILDSSYKGVVGIEFSVPHKSGVELSSTNGLANVNLLKMNPDELMGELEKSVKKAEIASKAGFVTSGQYPIILSQSGVGTLVHEAIGAHLLSGQYIKAEISTAFAGRQGQHIFPEFLSIYDKPQLNGANGFFKYDEEGVPAQEVTLVKDGVLVDYLHDRDSAHFFGVESNGHSRMQWVGGTNEDGNFQPIMPEPRVGNLDIISSNEVSDDELKEIMRNYCRESGIPFGLYVESHAGQVSPVTSEFTLFPSGAKKIFADGRPDEPILGFYVIGDPYTMLNNIALTGDTYKITNGSCGAQSGFVPTQEKAPSAFIPYATIQAVPQHKSRARLLD